MPPPGLVAWCTRSRQARLGSTIFRQNLAPHLTSIFHLLRSEFRPYLPSYRPTYCTKLDVTRDLLIQPLYKELSKVGKHMYTISK